MQTLRIIFTQHLLFIGKVMQNVVPLNGPSEISLRTGSAGVCPIHRVEASVFHLHHTSLASTQARYFTTAIPGLMLCSVTNKNC